MNLSLHLESLKVYWKGVRGLQWQHHYFHLSRLYQVWPPPSILLILLGGNDLGNIRMLDLLFMIKRDLHSFTLTSPGTTIVFSKIISRLSWLSSLKRKVKEKNRKSINRTMEKFMPTIGGLSY